MTKVITANRNLLKVRKGGKKGLKNYLKTFTVFNAAPLLYTLMASLVKASTNKSFIFNYSLLYS